jgi:hypothetical protein
MAARYATALLPALLAGCFNPLLLYGPLPPAAARAPRAPLPGDSSPAAPDLRIPADAVAAAPAPAAQAPPKGDIPVVPVPLPPLGQANAPRPGAAATASTQAAPAAAAQAPPAPAPAPKAAPGEVVQAGARVPASANAVRLLYQQATQAFAGIDSYQARVTRREQANGKPQPEEVMLFRFRKQPWSVYMKWLSEAGRGREVIYVKDRHGNQLHTLLAAGDHPLKPAGSRLSLPIDSVFVRMACKRPITEAGIGASINRLGGILDALARGENSRGTLADLGVQTRPDYETPLALVEQTVPHGVDPALPRGGRRLYGFDTQNHLPVLVVTQDDKGQEVEYYRYDRLQYPVRLDDDDFDPDKLWGKAPVRPAAGSAAP